MVLSRNKHWQNTHVSHTHIQNRQGIKKSTTLDHKAQTNNQIAVPPLLMRSNIKISVTMKA